MTDERRTIPDPGLTLSEAINAMGSLRHIIATSKSGTDPVLQSVWEKLQRSAHDHGRAYPEELQAVEAEIDFQKMFAEGGG